MRRFTDPEIVLHYEGSGGGMEETLEANSDGTLTYDKFAQLLCASRRREGQGGDTVAGRGKGAVSGIR